jgi:hypothetical protein
MFFVPALFLALFTIGSFGLPKEKPVVIDETFNKVFLNYKKFEDGTIRTTAYLVSENSVHVGVSLFSNRGDNFNKSRGRQMALGRAEYAFNVYSGTESSRDSHGKRREELSFTVLASNGQTVADIVESLLK